MLAPPQIFHGYELLLFKRFQSDQGLWYEWRGRLWAAGGGADGGAAVDVDELGEIPQSLWFLSVVLHKRQQHLLHLIAEEIKREKSAVIRKSSDTLISLYLSYHQFTEFHLDSIFKYGDDNKLPREIFKCPNVTHLSLKYNSLDHLPADIGRMNKLEHLALTNNKLQVHSIPYTLTFCRRLKTLLLDNNLLDALPGFLLKMPAIETVYRHGNHNYFKATFMWYHTDVNYRIIPAGGSNSMPSKIPKSLQFWAAKAVIGLKIDFFNEPCVADVLRDYISEIYSKFYICYYCHKAYLSNLLGYKVITFKNPYLGNTCVPFQHWACSIECAKALEVPARIEQIAAAEELDEQYEEYIHHCQQVFMALLQDSKKICTCSKDLPPGVHGGEETETEADAASSTTKCHCTIQ